MSVSTMVKSIQIGDESALINAFDHAMSNYKVMHNYESSNEVSKVMNVNGGNSPLLVIEEGLETKRHSDAVENSFENVEYMDPSLIKENLCVETCAPQCDMNVTNVPVTDDAVYAYSNPQIDEGYTQLLDQYYEIEGKRQQIIWQLHQSGYGNYQYSGEHSAVALRDDAQDLQVPASQVSENTSTDVPLEKSPGQNFALKIDDTFTTAMEVAEKAFASLKNNSGNSKVHEEGENDGEHRVKEMAGDTSSDTDLTEVLKAWYSAGFFTARYLMEQSAKKGHG